ncbi:MAG TPA: PHP domain-containing protein [Vicinamibacterales bacterium]
MIDLHTHTTASDGRLSAAELVGRAAAAGITTLAVTDHDTVASCAPAEDACRHAGITFVAGIEITAMREGRDVHVLAYFFDYGSPELLALLAEQRRNRIARARQMMDKLAQHGIALNEDEILRPALVDQSRAVGRPWIARALVSAGHVATTNEAFDRWLSRGQPAFVVRVGPSPAAVASCVHDAGGVASIAHPGLLERDDWLQDFARDGVDALEAFHSRHDADTTARYLARAVRLGLAVSGGSDYHADDSHGPDQLGVVHLPTEYYDRLAARRPTSRATASGAETSS